MFAGPNGSGKSSIIRATTFSGKPNLLDADAIAKRRNSKDPRQAAIEAGREVLRRTNEYVRNGEDFGIETTLAGNWTFSAIQVALDQKLFVRLLYICVDNPERNIQRVRERVAGGGHDIPEDDIRRRYVRSLSNLQKVLRIVDHALVYDNSGAAPELLVELKSGIVVTKLNLLPSWAQNLLDHP